MIDKGRDVIDNVGMQQEEDKITIPHRKLGKCL